MDSTLHPDMFRERLRELCARHHGTVRRICWRYVQNGPDADDLAQETLLRAAGAFGGFCGNADTSTWLHRVAVNRCLDHLRAKARARAHHARLCDVLREELRLALAQPDPAADAEALRLHARRVLATLTAQLQPPVRVVAELCLEQGLSQREAARRLRISRGAVEKRLRHVRVRASRLWYGLPEEDPPTASGTDEWR